MEFPLSRPVVPHLVFYCVFFSFFFKVFLSHDLFYWFFRSNWVGRWGKKEVGKLKKVVEGGFDERRVRNDDLGVKSGHSGHIDGLVCKRGKRLTLICRKKLKKKTWAILDHRSAFSVFYRITLHVVQGQLVPQVLTNKFAFCLNHLPHVVLLPQNVSL